MATEPRMTGHDERMRLRRASADDIAAMMAIKDGLRMPADGGVARGGGFLLGSSRDGYALFVEHAVTVVLEDRAAGTIVGFAIALPDPIVRGSDLWTRREAIAWEAFDPRAVENEPVAYFEQLAIVPDRRYGIYAPALAFAALKPLLDAGARHLFATVVKEPVHNVAALPLLLGMGGRKIGEIEETYEGAGRIRSEVYYIDRSDVAAGDPLAGSALGRRVVAMARRLGGGWAGESAPSRQHV
jgi:hypothetical protein